jgi:cytochrome b561
MRRSTAFHSNLTLLVLIAGIAGVVHDSLARGTSSTYMNLHAAFGLLLWVSVVVRFHRRLRQSPRMLPIDIREFSRHLSRLVCLVLYLLMFASLAARTAACVWRTGCPAAPDFQGYLGCGFIALVTIQALAALCRLTAWKTMAPAPG